MRILHSSIFCAVCTIVVGILLFTCPVETQKWLSVLLGILFIIPGISSVIMYYWHKAHETEETGTHVEFPLSGWGSILLGIAILLIQAYEKQTITIILSAILIILSISTVINLLMNSKYWHIGFGNFVIPVIIFIVGTLIIVNYRVAFIEDNEVIHKILGLSFALYGVAELYYSIRLYSGKAKQRREQQAAEGNAEAEENDDEIAENDTQKDENPENLTEKDYNEEKDTDEIIEKNVEEITKPIVSYEDEKMDENGFF